MITVGMNYDVLEGKGPMFEESFRQVCAVMSKMPGHVRSRLYRDIDSPGAYLIHSEWDSKEAFMAFIRSPEFASTTRWGAEQVLAGRPTHKIYGE